MLPGNHLRRTTYGPGLAGSPNSTADSFVPAAFLTHLMSAGVLKSTAVRSMSAELPHEAVSRITRTAGRYTRFKTAITPPSVALDAEHADFAYLNAKDFFRQEKKSCSGVFSLCRCFLETILLFPTLRATFRRHICPRSSQPWLRGFVERSFPKRPRTASWGTRKLNRRSDIAELFL